MSLKIPGLIKPVEMTQPLYPGSHFTWAEFTRNGKRIPESTNFGGILIPAAQITANGVKLARELDAIRMEFVDAPRSKETGILRSMKLQRQLHC